MSNIYIGNGLWDQIHIVPRLYNKDCLKIIEEFFKNYAQNYSN